MADEVPQAGAVRPPRGSRSSKVDDKGRLKLPVDIERYLQARGVTKMFVTSFDGRTALIYSDSDWEEVVATLEAPSPNAKSAATLIHRANHYGDDVTVDNQGRVLIPPDLRREMGVENQPVRMQCVKRHIEVYSEAVNEARLNRELQAEDLLESFLAVGLP